MTIDELQAELPNGFHDARLRSYSADLATQIAEFIMDVWVGDLHSPLVSERERYRPARLELLGVSYLIVDEVAARPTSVWVGTPLSIDTCAADENDALARQVPHDGFAGRFFVNEWNASIHFAARDTRLTWLGVN